jgi:hypothetical protein
MYRVRRAAAEVRDLLDSIVVSPRIAGIPEKIGA